MTRAADELLNGPRGFGAGEMTALERLDTFTRQGSFPLVQHETRLLARWIRELQRDLEDAYKTIRALAAHEGESCPALDCPHEGAVRAAMEAK